MELLTHTKRRDFLNCPRYFYHRHEQGLELIAKKAGRRRGTIFGDALQAARDAVVIPTVTSLDKTRFPASALKAAMDSIDASYDELHPRDQAEATDQEIERVKVRVMAGLYIVRYGLAARREVEFELPLWTITGGASKTFRRAGKIDGIEVVRPQVGRVIEDKFVAQIQKAMIDRLPLDAQATEYVDALLSKGWGAEVAYRHTRVPGKNPLPPKQFKTKDDYPGETLDEFEQRLVEDVNDRPESYFDEQILIFPQVHLADYRSGRSATARMIQDARLRAAHHGHQFGFPMNPSRCWEFGGCEYIPLCTKQPDAIDRYTIVPDNVELRERDTDGTVTDEYGPTGGEAGADQA